MIKKNFLFCFCLLWLFATALQAVELSTDNDKIRLTVEGLGFFRFGQVVRGTGVNNANIEKNIWTERANAALSVGAIFDDKFKVAAGIEADLMFPWPMEQNEAQTKLSQTLISLREAYGLFFTGDDNWLFDVCAGYFPYKYNPDVRNLGEFMFRSGTFPAYIITDFDYPMAKLLGLRTGLKLFERSFSQDLILSSETVFYPMMDWSLSYLLSYDFLNKGFLEIGGGINFSHLFSVYHGNVTTPKYVDNLGNHYLDENGDTAYYSFKGTKAMGRFSIDPKVLFDRDLDIFGESDLKLYAEILIIGLESYPDSGLGINPTPSYSDWKEKAPITFGINLPTFSLFDVFNLEFEYWGSKYHNDYRHLLTEVSKPIPPGSTEGVDESKWKWSVYLKKSLFDGHLTLTTQFARDHMRQWGVLINRANHREMLVQEGNWWWVTKIGYSF